MRYMDYGGDPFTLCVPVAIFDRNCTIDLPKNRMIKKSNSECFLLHFIARPAGRYLTHSLLNTATTATSPIHIITYILK